RAAPDPRLSKTSWSYHSPGRRQPARFPTALDVAVHWAGGCGAGGGEMKPLTRITRDPAVMGGRPCIRGLRVTVGTVGGLVAGGQDAPEILCLYPYLEAEDIREPLAYAAWRSEEIEVPIPPP